MPELCCMHGGLHYSHQMRTTKPLTVSLYVIHLTAIGVFHHSVFSKTLSTQFGTFKKSFYTFHSLWFYYKWKPPSQNSSPDKSLPEWCKLQDNWPGALLPNRLSRQLQPLKTPHFPHRNTDEVIMQVFYFMTPSFNSKLDWVQRPEGTIFIISFCLWLCEHVLFACQGETVEFTSLFPLCQWSIPNFSYPVLLYT